MTECKHAVPGSDEYITDLLNKIDDLYNELDNCDIVAGGIKNKMIDRQNRRAIGMVQYHIELAMDILEEIK